MRESHTVLNVLLMLRCVCLSLTNVQSVAVIQTHKIVDEYSREKNRLNPVRAQTSNFALRGDTAHFFTAFSNFDFGVAMVFMKNVLNKDC